MTSLLVPSDLDPVTFNIIVFLALEVMYFSLKAGETTISGHPPISVRTVMQPMLLILEVFGLCLTEPATPLLCEPQAPLPLPE